MRSFSKKLAFVLAAAMVFTAFAPAAKAEAAKEMTMNKSAVTIYLTDGTGKNDHGVTTAGYGNIPNYDFYVKNKPDDYKTACKFAWDSSDKAVATVDNKGFVTPVSVGTTEITCVVTDAANKATTVKATVTVKANADDVVISNADDFDGAVKAVGETIDLDRRMYAKDDIVGTTKRGVGVTDYTRWIAADADGKVVDATVVEVNQANGQFTFKAAGEYKLYCETYQSSKYTVATATSDVVSVTVEDASNEIVALKQTTVNQFEIKFANKVEKDKLGAVTVDRVFANGDFTMPVVVYKAELAKDGMSATVTMINDLSDKVQYNVSVDGFEAAADDYFVASLAAPTTLKIFVDAANADVPYEEVGVKAGETKIASVKFALINAAGVDVTSIYASKGAIEFSAENAPEGCDVGTDYTNNCGEIGFEKENLEVTVKAVYQPEDNVEDDPAKNLTAEKFFVSYKEAPVELVGIADWKIAGTKDDWSDASKKVAFDNAAYTLDIKYDIVKGDKKLDPITEAKFDENDLDGDIMVVAVTPDYAAISGGKITFFQQKEAAFIVYYVTYDADGNAIETALDKITVEATAAKKLADIKLDANNFTLGNVSPWGDKTVTVTGKDNYGNDYATGEVKIEGLDDYGKAVANTAAASVSGSKIILSGTELAKALKTGANKGNFKLKVTAGDISKTLEFTVKVATGDVKLDVVAEGFDKDVARTAKDANTKAAKVGKITVYETQNGVTSGVLEELVGKYNKDAVSAGKYYFTITKDGKDIADKVDVSKIDEGVVSINFSGTKTEGSRDVVTYDLGAGKYEFTLYMGYKNSLGKDVAKKVATVVETVTCTQGSYTYVGKAAETMDPDDVLAALKVKNAEGKDVDKATAKYDALTTVYGGYVYVTSVTFYDEVATGVYAKYTVNVGSAFKLAE